MARDSANNVHIVYTAGEANLGHLKWDGSGWSLQSVPMDPSYSGVDLAADLQGNLCLAWNSWDSQASTAHIMFRSCNGSVWASPEALTANSGGLPSVDADSLGRPHVVWISAEAWNPLLYRTKSPTGWETPIQLNLGSQSATSLSDTALSVVDDQLHAVWISSPNGKGQIYYNHAYVGATNDVYPPSVSVTAPDAGRVLPVGSLYTIRWEAADNRGVASVDLHYSSDGGTNWTTIATTEVNDGMYDWMVQSVGTNGGIIRVTARDGAGNAGVGYSGSFTTSDFTPPTVTIVAPANGATLVGNSVVNVNWNATDNVAVTRIDLEYSLNNGGAWSEMATELPNSGACAWTVPNVETEVLLIRVIAGDAAGYAASAVSQPLRIVRANHPPFPPNSPFPLHGGSSLPPASVRLQWSCDDLDGDILTYQVYLGTNGSPALAATVIEAQFAPGFLLPGTTYHWQVIASDGKATNAGPVWDFTTSDVSVRVTGQVELESFLGTGTVPLHTRTVTFVATAAGSTTPLQTWVLALTNVTGAVFNFALTDVPPATAAVSAKTDWNLRRKLAVTFDGNGLAVANFTGGSKLLGGDINTTHDNKINAFDNTLLKNKWGALMPGAAPADINGDGNVNAFDNTILKNNWGSTGDAQ
jgi:hypothetical protein